MDIRQHRKAELLLEIRKNFHCLFEADSTLSLQGCAIGLVEAGLVDKTDAELISHLLETACHIESVFTRFHLARARYQGKRRTV